LTEEMRENKRIGTTTSSDETGRYVRGEGRQRKETDKRPFWGGDGNKQHRSLIKTPKATFGWGEGGKGPKRTRGQKNFKRERNQPCPTKAPRSFVLPTKHFEKTLGRRGKEGERRRGGQGKGSRRKREATRKRLANGPKEKNVEYPAMRRNDKGSVARW